MKAEAANRRRISMYQGGELMTFDLGCLAGDRIGGAKNSPLPVRHIPEAAA
jgi:hypothetical protein